MNLEELRKKHKMTRTQVAKFTGKTVTYIYMIEHGLRTPSDKLRQDLANLYECSITDIFLATKLTKS